MARGRRRETWEHTAALIHWIAAKGFAGERVDPEALNPIPPLLIDQAPADPAAEAREGWANLRAGLAEVSRGWYGGGER